jgi:hypothetical protein
MDRPRPKSTSWVWETPARGDVAGACGDAFPYDRPADGLILFFIMSFRRQQILEAFLKPAGLHLKSIEKGKASQGQPERTEQGRGAAWDGTPPVVHAASRCADRSIDPDSSCLRLT